MAKANIVVTVVAGEVSYTATLVRRGEWPVTVEGTDGFRWDAFWEPGMCNLVSDDIRPESMSDATCEAIEIALRDAPR